MADEQYKWLNRATAERLLRGESLEEFQKTRNAPGALYSVAGNDAGTLAWDKK